MTFQPLYDRMAKLETLEERRQMVDRFFDFYDIHGILPSWCMDAPPHGKLIFVTLTLSDENRNADEGDIWKRVKALLQSKENTPAGYWGCFEKTEQDVWHVHILLHYTKTGHNGLKHSFFKRYWTLGYIDVKDATPTKRSLTDMLTYLSKQPYRKFGDATYFEDNFKMLL